MWCAKITLMLFASLAVVTGANAQDVEETYYNELVENPDGSFSGGLSVLRNSGQLSDVVYQVEPDGYFRVYDEETGALVSHGLITEDGAASPKPPSTPVTRPPRGGNVIVFGLCMLGEELGRARCNAQCGSGGIKSYNAGVCGFGSTCECFEPLPPPVFPTVPPGTFIAPWTTIDNFWNRYNESNPGGGYNPPGTDPY